MLYRVLLQRKSSLEPHHNEKTPERKEKSTASVSAMMNHTNNSFTNHFFHSDSFIHGKKYYFCTKIEDY